MSFGVLIVTLRVPYDRDLHNPKNSTQRTVKMKNICAHTNLPKLLKNSITMCVPPTNKKSQEMWGSINYFNPEFELGPKALGPKLKLLTNT